MSSLPRHHGDLNSRRPTHYILLFRAFVQEVWIVLSLGWMLLQLLGVGYKWLLRMLRTALYSLILSPAILRMTWYYMRVPLRGIRYGKEPRNKLDVYLPVGRKKDEVRFQYGGLCSFIALPCILFMRLSTSWCW